MCPACFAAAAWIAAGTLSTGGLAALGVKRILARTAANNVPAPNPPKEDRHE